MKRFIPLLILCISCAGVFGQQVTGAIIEDVKVLKKTPTGILVLNVKPRSATSYVDNIRLSGADEVKLDVGTHTLYVEAPGYIAQERKFTIQKNEVCTIDITLSNTDQATIYTNVPATRTIDGVDYGEAQSAVYDLSIGRHTIEMSAEGYYPLQKVFEVKQGGRNVYSYQLKEEPRKPASEDTLITIETNVSCHRTIDEVEYESAQKKEYSMKWGEHALSLSADGYYPIKTKFNVVYEGQTLFHYDLHPVQSGMAHKHEIGVVAGGLNGLSHKYWVTEHFSVHTDFAVGFNDVYKFDATVNPNLEYNFILPSSFYIYMGGGINIGYAEYFNNDMGKFGVNGIIGLEYIFENVPVSLALDFRPGYGLAFLDHEVEQWIPNGEYYYYYGSYIEDGYWVIIGKHHDFDWKLGLSVRYYF